MAAYRRRRRIRRPRRASARSVRRLRRTGRGLKGNVVTPVYPTLPPFGVAGGRGGRRARIGAKRRRAGTQTDATVKRLKFTDPGGYNQWRRYSFTKTLGRQTIRKTLRTLSDYYDFVWRRVNPLRQQGALFMPNWRQVNANADDVYRPIIICDLTSANVGPNLGTAVYNIVRQTGTTTGIGAGNSHIEWVGVDGLAASGAGSVFWNTVATSDPTSTNISLAKNSLLKWSEIRLDLWGARQRPTEFVLTLCQMDERLMPEPGSTFVTNREGVDWWDDLAYKLITNPNVRKPPHGTGSNYLKVLDRKTFMLDPQSTTEADQDPMCKTVRVFYRMNRQCNWDWRLQGLPPFTVDIDPAGFETFTPVIDANRNNPTVHPKARVFFMITAANYSGTATGNTQTADGYPSINLQVYNRFVDY